MAKRAVEPASGIGRRRAAKDDASEAYRARRAEIKAAAGVLFTRGGFRGTSIGRVAAASGIDRATLYYYVGSKEELGHVSPARSQWSKQMRTLNKRYEDVGTGVIQAGMDEGTVRPVAASWVMAYGVVAVPQPPRRARPARRRNA